MAKVKIENGGAEVNWPTGEKIPATMDEALERGWGVCTDDVTAVDGERSATGVYTIEKTVGRRRLTLKIRYRAEFTHGRPFDPQARKYSYTLLEPRKLMLSDKAVNA